MDKVPNNIVDIINNFIQEATKDNIHISKVILFGSYAKGTNHKWSDIDIALISNDFEGISFYDNRKIRRAKLKASTALETHTYRSIVILLYSLFADMVFLFEYYNKHRSRL